jgi:hypothetical protein
MTHGKLVLCAVLISSLSAACSGGSDGTGSAGTTGASGTTGSGGTTGGAGTGAGTAGTTGSAGTTGAAGTSGGAGTGALATPTTLVTATGCEDIRMTLVGSTIYYTDKNKGTVSSISTAGGTPMVLATAQKSPGAIAADATAVFYAVNGTTPADHGVMKIALPAAGAPVTFIASESKTESALKNENLVNALLLSGGTLYIGRYTDALKVSATAAAPATATLIGRSPPDDNGKPAAFAVDATHLYQTEIDHLAVSRQKTDGTQNGLLGDKVTRVMYAPDRIAVSQGSLALDAIALGGGSVVWANNTNIVTKAVGQAEDAPIVNIATSNGYNTITGFVISGSTLYLGESLDNKVEKVAFPAVAATVTAPVEATVIATNQMSPGQFLADATNIYWRTSDCKIVKLAK